MKFMLSGWPENIWIFALDYEAQKERFELSLRKPA